MIEQAEAKTPALPGDVDDTHSYDGHGTEEDPFVVEFQKDDPYNPMNWSQARKWSVTAVVTMSVFAVTFTSSAYSVSSEEITRDFNISPEVCTLGLSLFVLGFAVGPPVWGPLLRWLSIDLDRFPRRSELYGRRSVWMPSHVAMVACVGGTAGCTNAATLLVLRFLAGTFGGSTLINSGGTIADLFPPAHRGLAMSLYCVAPFLGPILAPIVGGFMTQSVGWRWVQGLCCIFIGVIGVVGIIFLPETYGPVLLEKRASSLSRTHGTVYVTILEKRRGRQSPSEVFKRAILRPWVLLFWEPIVFAASVYMAIIYGTVYLFMGAMPIVYNESRGWSAGIGGLAFLGITVGIILGTAWAIYDNNVRYKALVLSGSSVPESRLPPAIVGAIVLPVGMFAFAWTNYPNIHWSVSIILSAPFGFGCVLVILPMINYLIDSYTVYAASVMAAGAVIRAITGAAFPLFTSQMYHNLGIHWASSIPAFLTLICMPFPFVMYRYGARLRLKCKYASEAAEMLKQMQIR